MVGVVPREPERMRDENLAVASINGDRCGDASVPDAQLEEVSNSISADEDGGIYVVSTKAQYRFDLRRRRAATQPGAPSTRAAAASGGSTLSSGSGSTPDVVGTDPGDDKLVAITDGQKLMHLTLFWRDEIPRGLEGPAGPRPPDRLRVPGDLRRPRTPPSRSPSSRCSRAATASWS